MRTGLQRCLQWRDGSAIHNPRSQVEQKSEHGLSQCSDWSREILPFLESPVHWRFRQIGVEPVPWTACHLHLARKAAFATSAPSGAW